MEKFIAKFMRSSIFGSIALAILGVFLFIKSELTIVSITYVIGAVLVGIGLVAMLKYIANINKSVKNEIDIIYGTVTVILGIVVISNPKAIASIIPFVLGIIIILSSAAKLGYGFELRKNNNQLWTGTVIIALITMLCGVLLIFNPFAGAEFILKIVGALIFIYAVLDIVSTFRIRKTIKPLKKALQNKEVIVEAEVIEDNTNIDKKKKKKNKREGEE